MAAKMPFLPLFFGDLLASTALWGGEERALFMLLLAYQWTAGPIPKDTAKLARMVQYDLAKFKTLWETVGKKFSAQDGGLVNPRLEQHRVKANQIAERNHSRAKTAAEKRWDENAPSNAPSNAQSNTPSTPCVDAIHSIPFHTIPKKNPDRAAARPDSGDESAEFLSLKAVYPRRGGSQRWPDAKKAIRARLAEGHTWGEILDGASRYAAFIRATGKERTEYVLQAATFCGSLKQFMEPWDLPATKAETAQDANLEAARTFLRGVA